MLWFQTLGSAVGVCAGCNNSSAGRAYYPKAHPGDSAGRGPYGSPAGGTLHQLQPRQPGTSSLTLLQPAGCTGTTIVAAGSTSAPPTAAQTPAHAVLALHQPRACNNSASSNTGSSSGYDSFYSRHSPHRRCYMLKNLTHQDHERHKAISPAKECDGEDCNALGSKKSHRHSHHSSRSSSSSSHSRIVHQRGSCSGDGKQSTVVASSDDQRFM